MKSYKFSDKEMDILKRLAAQVAEIAQRPIMQERIRLWTLHNDLKIDTPLVLMEPQNGWKECIPANSLLCEEFTARAWEMQLRKQIFWADRIKDDTVIEPYFNVPYIYHRTSWGIETKRLSGGARGSYIVIPGLEDYERDFHKLRCPEIIIDWEASAQLLEQAHEIFDGILTVRQKMEWWWTLGLTIDYIELRGYEEFLCDMIAEPEWVERMMDFLCECKIKMLDSLEAQGVLSQNTDGTFIGTGGLGYTNHIPAVPVGVSVTTGDMWGQSESQELVSVNPDLFGELIFPRLTRILERFGMNGYGCCEPYQDKWKYIRQIPNLRRVSVSPWADWKTVPELLGKNYIASVKPSPTPLSLSVMNEEIVRRECRRAVEETRGGICEFIMKDTETLGYNPNNAIRWVEIMREEIDRVYKA